MHDDVKSGKSVPHWLGDFLHFLAQSGTLSMKPIVWELLAASFASVKSWVAAFTDPMNVPIRWQALLSNRSALCNGTPPILARIDSLLPLPAELQTFAHGPLRPLQLSMSLVLFQMRIEPLFMG
jgi:hypothetical protein